MAGYGLVLGGGGAKGGYEIGVWKALKELNIPLCAVAGTSVGALNGAMIVQDDFDKAYELWTSLSVENVINLEKEIAIVDETNKISSKFILKTIKHAIKDGGLDISPLKKTLQEVIDEERIRASQVDFGLVTFSLTDFEPLSLFKKDIPQGKMVDYLLASACFPAFKLHQIDDKTFVDGGVYDNIPVSLMINKKIQDIIAVDVSGIGVVRKVQVQDCNTVYIKNSEYLGATLDFNPQRSKDNIELGYYDTLKKFGKLTGKTYYILPHTQSKQVRISDWRTIYSILGMREQKNKIFYTHLLRERIEKTLAEYCEGELNSSSVFAAMAEITAEQLKVNRRQIYTLDGLIKKIHKKLSDVKTSKDFLEYIEVFPDMLTNLNQLNFEEKVEEILAKGKLIIAYNLLKEEKTEQLKWFKQFVAIAFPKIAIANAFVVLISSEH